MGIFSGYLICTDCDGTLTDSNVKVSEENAKAIKYFQDEGGLFTLATGRFAEHANLFKEQFEINAPMVSLNGTALFDLKNNKLIKGWTMDREACRELMHYINENWRDVWEYWLNFSHHESTGFKPMDCPVGDKSLDELIDTLPEQIYKIVTIQPREVTISMQEDLKSKFGDKFRFDTSWPEGLEIQSIDSGKGVAVKYMKEHLGVDIHTTVGIGDYENDISLLECADIGYAVENAIESVKAVANRHTVSNNNSAIAHIIYQLEEEVKKENENEK